MTKPQSLSCSPMPSSIEFMHRTVIKCSPTQHFLHYANPIKFSLNLQPPGWYTTRQQLLLQTSTPECHVWHIGGIFFLPDPVRARFKSSVPDCVEYKDGDDDVSMAFILSAALSTAGTWDIIFTRVLEEHAENSFGLVPSMLWAPGSKVVIRKFNIMVVLKRGRARTSSLYRWNWMDAPASADRNIAIKDLLFK